MTKPNAAREAAYTARIVEHLRAADDFVPASVLRRLLGDVRSSVFPMTLAHLRRHRVIDFIEDGGITFWYALPAGLDTRVKVFPEIVHGTSRRKRTRKPAPVAQPKENGE